LVSSTFTSPSPSPWLIFLVSIISLAYRDPIDDVSRPLHRCSWSETLPFPPLSTRRLSPLISFVLFLDCNLRTLYRQISRTILRSTQSNSRGTSFPPSVINLIFLTRLVPPLPCPFPPDPPLLDPLLRHVPLPPFRPRHRIRDLPQIRNSRSTNSPPSFRRRFDARSRSSYGS